MANLNIHSTKFVKNWKKQNKDILLSMHPDVSEEEVDKFLDKAVDDNIKVRTGEIYNNYNHKKQRVNLLQLVDWYHHKKPIVAGHGCLFMNHALEPNPAARMQDNFMILRKQYKNKMYTFPEDSYDYGVFNRMQNSEKISCNSWYGCSGASISTFYNLFTASSTTSSAQGLISVAAWAFEGFMGDNFRFIDLDECFFYMENIKKEKRKIKMNLKAVSKEKLLDRLSKHFYTLKEEYFEPLVIYVDNLEQEDINRIYYKNNLMEFSLHPEIRTLLNYIIKNIDTFKDPNKVPKNVKEDMDELWGYYNEFVLYNNFWFSKIRRLKEDTRNSVHVIDTDSCFVSMNPWYEFVNKFIISYDDTLLNRDKDEMKFIIINTMCYILANMINEILLHYGKTVNIPKEYRGRLNMKNEFFFSRIILAGVKKRYITSMRLKEGHEIYPEKIKVTGQDFMKSSTREETKKFFIDICKEKIMTVDRIDIPDILRTLEDFETIIKDSLHNKEKNFLTPKSVKELEAYKDPYREQGVRSIIAWNIIYTDNTIELPGKVDMVKVKMNTLDSISDLEEKEPIIYERIKKGIFESKEEKIAKKGIEVIAIPRNIKRIPDWMLPYIDYDTIMNNNITKFHGVLESLGIQILQHSKEDYFSNVIKL